MGKSSYRYFSVTLSAGQVLPLNVYARYITILSNSITTNPEISIGGDQFETIKAGLSIELPEGEHIQEIQLRNPAGGAMTLTFALSAGKITDASLVVSGIVDVSASADGMSTPAALTITTAAPGAASISASSTRRGVIIQNQGPNPVWVGDSNVDGASNRGIKIAVDDSIILDFTGAIYMRSTGGNSTVSYMDLTQ